MKNTAIAIQDDKIKTATKTTTEMFQQYTFVGNRHAKKPQGFGVNNLFSFLTTWLITIT